ncbi:MAG: MlaD family protein [Alphaproteobacteria bacterium]|nr:MlaD family protein [Rhodospirillales bacterium]MCW9045003.1 MlaD family protein [Alphaproteobacteria bacterium]
MKNAKINYLVVGGFVITTVVLLLVAIALLTGRTGSTDNYFAVYDNVSGVKYGTQIRYEGYPIGQVEDIEPFEEEGRMQFRVALSVAEGWKIPKDSIAQIAAPGLLAAITISVQAGISTEALKPGTRITSREKSDMFAALSSVAGQVGDLSETSIKPFLANLNETVLSFNKVLSEDGTGIISDLKGASTSLAARAPAILENMDKAVVELKEILSTGNRQKMETTLTSLQESSRNLQILTANLDKTRSKADVLLKGSSDLVLNNSQDLNKSVVDLKYIMETTARRIDSINLNLEGASRNLNEFSRHIRQNPGLLLGGTPPKDNAQ